MYFLDKLKLKIANEINNTLDDNLVGIGDFVYPPNSEMGDLSLPCFSLAGKLGKVPGALAGELIKTLNIDEIETIKVVGPYLNFYIKKEILSERVLNEIKKGGEKYGANSNGHGKKIMIEFANQNTHKEVHIGHLRNFCYGDAVNKILKANGYTMIPVSYINDFGINVAKTIWWTYHPENTEAKNLFAQGDIENKGYFLGKMYAEASQRIAEDKPAKEIVEFVMRKIESREGEEYKLWQETRSWSMEQFQKIYDDLGIKFKRTFYESELIEEGRKIANELLEKGILKESEGAIIADLSEYNLSVLVILRKDGTALYPVADLALAKEKFSQEKIDESIVVVDTRQELYFKQLFKLFELLEYKEKFVHLGYDFVNLPSGMMSSRSGNIISYEDLRDKMIVKLKEETRNKHSDWNDKKINSVAEKIAIGTMKFEMSKISAKNIITFDIDQALRFDGFTAAYLMYTCARINSLSKKYQEGNNLESEIKFNNLVEQVELNILKHLAKYPEIIRRAGDDFDPSEVAKYIFNLAQEFNDFYQAVPIIKAYPEIAAARILLSQSVRQAIANGLGLLGIEVIEEM